MGGGENGSGLAQEWLSAAAAASGPNGPEEAVGEIRAESDEVGVLLRFDMVNSNHHSR